MRQYWRGFPPAGLKYLLETNIISELRKGGRANPGVTAFFASPAAEDIYLSVQTNGEIRRDVESIRNRGDRVPEDVAARVSADDNA